MELIVVADGSLVDQVPPATELVNVSHACADAQTFDGPVIIPAFTPAATVAVTNVVLILVPSDTLILNVSVPAYPAVGV